LAKEQGLMRILQVEEEIRSIWEEKKIPKKVLGRKGKKKFFFLDGPPYVTERIHIGTAWNKVLKDAILRYKRMCGYSVWSIPGYDTHGLPIEVAVERKLGIKSKKEIIDKIGIDKFNQKCLEMAKRNMKVITEQFKSLGVWMDWDHPYITFEKEYISSIWWIIKKIYERGLLSEDLRVFHWCPRCETVLSEHEVSMGYKDVQTPSIYVKFPLKDNPDTSLLVWTTTPWTLPSNVAIAAHPDYLYALIETKSGEKLILMETRIDKVIREPYKILSVFRGSELRGKKYISPLQKFVDAQREVKAHVVILSSEYVSPEEGTGLVHIAPEHGKEDFELGKQYNLPIITLVDERGRFGDKAGKYKGLYIYDADSVIIEDLEKEGFLYFHETKVHRYPFCWRCHTPLFMKTTKQWIIKLSEIKNEIISANKHINWIPKWAGEQRFGLWLENIRDWVITRQRYWGTPTPIWKCEKCGNVVVIGSIEELKKKGFKVKDVHRPYIDNVTWKCEKCGGLMRRVSDVLDVWIDSGAAPWASLGYPKKTKIFRKLWPVDFITEGHDQTRGWFYAMLCLGVAAFSESPYKTVLVHGFTLDEQGRAMHKSLGNIIYPEELTEKYGVDTFRISALLHTIWEDMVTSTKRMEDIARTINIILNVYDFYDMYASIDNYSWPGKLPLKELREEDLWIISRLERIIAQVTEELERYHIHIALRKILDFAVEELSRKYVRMVRRRVWIEEEDKEKISVYHTLHYVLKRLALILAPFAPHISDYTYHKIISKFDKEKVESIHLMKWPKPNRKLVADDLEDRMDSLWQIITALHSIRQKHGIKIRQPLKEVIMPRSLYLKFSGRLLKILRDQANVLEIKTIPNSKIIEYIEYQVNPLTEKLGPKYKDKTNLVIQEVSKLSQKDIRKLIKKGEIVIKANGEKLKITLDDVTIVERAIKPFEMCSIADKKIFLNLRIDTNLYYEGLSRDLVRRIQLMRKEMGLDILDKIVTYIFSEEKDIENSVNYMIDYIKRETRSEKVLLEIPPDQAYTKEWRLNGKRVVIGVLRKRE